MAKKLTGEQWDIICFTEQYWRENGFFPSFSEIAIETNLNPSQVEQIVFDNLTKKHLEIRGIDWKVDRPKSESSAGDRRTGKSRRLSDIQLATVSTILNPADKRPVSQKLEELGVAPSTYAGWKKQKFFNDYMTKQGEALFGEYMPDMHNALVSKATRGDMSAIKFAYEVSGRYRPNQGDDIVNVKMIIVQLIEVIQKHVSDPLTLQNIAQDIQRIQGGLKPEGQADVSGDNQQTRAISP